MAMVNDTTLLTDGGQSDIGWLVAFDDGTEIRAAYTTSSTPPAHIGMEWTYSFMFSGRARVDGELQHIADYEALLSRTTRAGEYIWYDRPRAHPLYAEQHDGDSLLVAVRPARGDQPGIRGAWVLVDAASEVQNTMPGVRCQVDLDVTVLAPYREYDLHADVRRVFETGGF